MKPLISRAWPKGHLLNPATPYRNSASTDLAETFRRIREQEQREVLRREHGSRVREIRRG